MDLRETLMKEEAVTFGEMQTLVGVVTVPAERKQQGGTAVILLNPGIVHRVGPGRIYVNIARALARAGFPVLRFDFSGIGDTPVRHDNLRFEKSAIHEAQDAMDFLTKTRGIERFVLLGGCSGAQISLATACCDARVIGALLINFPIAQDDDEIATPELIHRGASYYYRKTALFSIKSWSRLFTGRANYRKLLLAFCFEIQRRLTSRKYISPEASQFVANLRRSADGGIQLIFLCSEHDPRLEDLQNAGGNELKELLAQGRVALEIIPKSDHTFSSLQDQERLLKAVLKRINAMRSPETEPSKRLPISTATDVQGVVFHQA